MRADSYKLGHFQQLPDGAQYVSSYIEARGCDAGWKETVFLGIQAFIKNYLTTPLTQADVDYAAERAAAHGVPFNREGWEYIVNICGGMLPLRIQALPEGTVIGLRNCLVQVMNTDPSVPWLTSFIETALLRSIWYPTTVCTQSREIKKLLAAYLEDTSDAPGAIDFMLHDFGARGVSSSESAGIGGMAHIVNFMGTDTLEGLEYARQFYNTGEEMPAYSVIATEHSTVTSWGQEHEAAMYRRMIESCEPGAIVSIVSDSYDIYNACATIYGEELYDEVVALGDRGSRLVVRPDSGDPTIVPVKCVKLLAGKFGTTENSKGFKVLPPFIRVLQGDGINLDSIDTILANLAKAGFAADNVVFGMGGALLQGVNRDTLQFAMKANAIFINGAWQDVYKNPVHGGKTSKRGRQAVYAGVTSRDENGPYVNDLVDVYVYDPSFDGLRPGVCKTDETLNKIRERAAI